MLKLDWKKISNALTPLVFFALGLIVAKQLNEKPSLTLEKTKTVIVPAVAVTNNGEGKVTFIKITAVPGQGRVMLSVLPFSEPETQQSFYNAIKAAYYVTHSNAKYDWLIEVNANTTLIGGPSAGLAVAVGASAILLNKELNKSCAYTGEVTPTGKVLPVGAVYEKAMAVLEAGYKCFIIPKANAIIYYYKPVEECKTIPIFPFGEIRKCTMYLERESLDLVKYFKQFNLTIIPVENLSEALKYALE